MGLATSTFFIFLDAGLGFGPYLLGFIVPYTTYGHLYFGLCFVNIVQHSLILFAPWTENQGSLKPVLCEIMKKQHQPSSAGAAFSFIHLKSHTG